MKYFFFMLLSIFSFNLNGQNMNHIQEVISSLFIATDQKDWGKVEDCFLSEVTLDYSSMTGNAAVKITPSQIIESWKGILPGFDFTHHQVGNFIIQENGSTATAFCYGTATHYIDSEKDKIWTVVGSYDFSLIKEENTWKISSMKFNFKYQSGNTNLPQVAINRLAQNSTTQETSIAERNKNTVRQFFDALQNEDVEALVNLFDEDAKHINPYHSGIFPEGANGKSGIRAYWTPVFPNFDCMEFPIEALYAMEDPTMVFVKYKGIIKLKNDAAYYQNNYYSTFKFNAEGAIIEYVEIFNPITAARGFGLLDQIK